MWEYEERERPGGGGGLTETCEACVCPNDDAAAFISKPNQTVNVSVSVQK